MMKHVHLDSPGPTTANGNCETVDVVVHLQEAHWIENKTHYQLSGKKSFIRYSISWYDGLSIPFVGHGIYIPVNVHYPKERSVFHKYTFMLTIK